MRATAGRWLAAVALSAAVSHALRPLADNVHITNVTRTCIHAQTGVDISRNVSRRMAVESSSQSVDVWAF